MGKLGKYKAYRITQRNVMSVEIARNNTANYRNKNKVHDQKLKEGEIFFSRVALHWEAAMVKTLA